MTILVAATREKQITFQHQPMTVWESDAAFRCDSCQRLSVATIASMEYPGRSLEDIDAATEKSTGARWEPKAVNRITYDDVPPVVGSAAAEAHASASIDAYRGAIILARAVVESAAKTLQAEGSDLYKKLDWLGEQRLLLPGIVEAAHEVRFFGNDMAHGDFSADVTKEDTAEILGIMDDVLDALFIQPARTARRAEARAARRNS